MCCIIVALNRVKVKICYTEISMKALDPLLKNEHTRRLYSAVGLRKPFVRQAKTKHYRLPELEANGGFLTLKPYAGPVISPAEWERLDYVTYPSDPDTFFAPLASADGQVKMSGFWEFGKTDRDAIWTPNAEKAPGLKRWVEGLGVNFGRVQLLRMEPNSLRETRWGLHLDDNNRLNPEKEGWIVRLWLELTDDAESRLVLRRDEFDRAREVQLPLARGTQLLVDSEYLFHGAWHAGTKTRYALIVSVTSGPEFERWLKGQLPATQPIVAPWLEK